MASRKVDDTIYVARATGVVRIGDTLFRYISGKTRVRAGHAVLKAAPNRFRAEPSDAEKIIEMRAIDAKPVRQVVEAPAAVVEPIEVIPDVLPAIEVGTEEA